jgi:transcriptional regulatory protein RtcR
MIREGKFRQDLLARINLWTFRLMGLKDRPEDIEPNLMVELENASRKLGKLVRMNKEAKEEFLRYASEPESAWTSNFRDLSGVATRMAVLSDSGRITTDLVESEFRRLRDSWKEDAGDGNADRDLVEEVLGDEAVSRLDLFDIPQLALVIRVCRRSKTMSEAGRTLFAESFKKRKSTNDSDRLRKYLAGFGLSWKQVTETETETR